MYELDVHVSSVSDEVEPRGHGLARDTAGGPCLPGVRLIGVDAVVLDQGCQHRPWPGSYLVHVRGLNRRRTDCLPSHRTHRFASANQEKCSQRWRVWREDRPLSHRVSVVRLLLSETCVFRVVFGK